MCLKSLLIRKTYKISNSRIDMTQSIVRAAIAMMDTIVNTSHPNDGLEPCTESNDSKIALEVAAGSII